MRYAHPDKFRSIFSCLALLAALCALPAVSAAPAAKRCDAGWPAWEQFKKTFVNADGRVIDLSSPRKQTVSEGQAYALFFALVADDRKSFAQLLVWTENNLAGGDLTARLPAWQWGLRDDRSWGVIDKNSATDADLWIAYALGTAGALWQEPRYTALSSLLARRILEEESAELPGLGLSLLPAPNGFTLSARSWKLNPSYLPLQLLRWFETQRQDTRWGKISDSALKIILGASPKGYSADWIIYDADHGFASDRQGAEKGDGGYNAIRVYLWAGMLAERAPYRRRLLQALQPMAALTGGQGYPPEFVDIHSGVGKGPGSSGFSAAMLPFLQALGADKIRQEQQLRLAAQPLKADAYYDQVLGLFALGWLEKRYRFDSKGRPQLRWQRPCSDPVTE